MGNIIHKPQQNPEYHQQDDHGEYQQVEEETFTCEICIEPVALANKFTYNDKCVDHSFCTDCMIKYIQVKLEDNVSNIQCPATSCNNDLEHLLCRPQISHQLFDKWCEVLCESTVLEVSRVYCPNQECSELILNECGDPNLKRCVCPHCKKPFRFGCKIPWHVSSTCEENIDENDASFNVLYATNNWRTCPKCGHCIERDCGCNIVQCRFVFLPTLVYHLIYWFCWSLKE
ncbi:E3 ubiquitin-protein ligase RSL1-like [Bidens hawaiensis]|uniref:E3 ubiquitin-protein ligase RSL1-like n=1 Tax=Bidens hawaiensis TaxID=980011 RepID=UPI004048FBDD